MVTVMSKEKMECSCPKRKNCKSAHDGEITPIFETSVSFFYFLWLVGNIKLLPAKYKGNFYNLHTYLGIYRRYPRFKYHCIYPNCFSIPQHSSIVASKMLSKVNIRAVEFYSGIGGWSHALWQLQKHDKEVFFENILLTYFN